MKVIVFYGTDCDAKTAWIPWLKEQLTRERERESYASWAKITKNIDINNDDIIVAWSTGAIFSIRYLYENNIKVKKLILISGFNNYIGNVPFVDNINKDFFMKDVKVAKDVADDIICIKSDNDPFISQQALNDFANKLNAKIINILGGGHFNSNAGYDKFPQLLSQIKG